MKRLFIDKSIRVSNECINYRSGVRVVDCLYLRLGVYADIFFIEVRCI